MRKGLVDHAQLAARLLACNSHTRALAVGDATR
jgi:hypothetical protein